MTTASHENSPAPASPLAARAKPAGTPLSRKARARRDRAFVAICVSAAVLSVLVLVALLGSIFLAGAGRLTWQFLSNAPSRFADQTGILPALVGTIAICTVCALTAIPIGIATAILLEEYKPANPILSRLHSVVQVNITNLAGVPSIVYGIVGLTVFVQFFNVMGTQQSPAFESGVSYYDRFVTVDGKTVQVPVPAADAPPTIPTPDVPFTDESGQPVRVTLLIAANLGGAINEAQERLDRFEGALEDEVETLRRSADDRPLLEGTLQREWAAAGFGSTLREIAPEFTTKMAAAVRQPGREGKKALRVEVKRLGSALAAVQNPGGLLDNAPSSRSMQPEPWYFRIPFGRSVLASGLTLMLVVLPIIIISTQESLRSVSNSLRQASLALGATKWQTIRQVTLAGALPGIMTGVILAMSRAIGEAAPVLIIAGIVYITFTPRHLMDDATAMPLQIYQWASLPQSEFHSVAAAGIILLLGILLCFNGVAIVIRQRAQQRNAK